MPFTTADVEKHTKKATTDALKRQWVRVANSWRINCMERGGSEDNCDASAIRVANGVVARQVEESSTMDIGQIAQSAIEIGLAVANGSGEITRERATKILRTWEAELAELWQPGMAPLAEAASFQVNGQAVTLEELKAAYVELQEVTKTIDGKPRPASDFLVVEDPDKPSTWHLPVKVNGKPDHRLMGGAWAALHRGYRGRRYEGPGKAEAVRKLKALYQSEDMEVPTAEANVAEYEIAGATIREVLMYLLNMWQDSQTPEEQMESDGHAIDTRDATEGDAASLSESETAVVETGRRAPVVVDFQVLKPGPGNKRDNHYYPADVVERDIHVFSGVDVFATEHKESDRTELTKVGRVLDCPTRFTEEGAPVAPVLIYDPNQAEKARNRADANALDTLTCSIFGKGRTRDGEVDGKKYSIVEAITHGRYLEFVSQGGAGGKALNLAENQPGGESVTEEKQADAAPVEEVREVEIKESETEAAEAAKPEVLGEDVVKEALDKTNLPEFAKASLAERQYESDDALKRAVDAATAEVKKLTGSGQVVGLGESKPEDKELSLEEREQRRKDAFNQIMQDVGLKEV